jgi:hypothetical protein
MKQVFRLAHDLARQRAARAVQEAPQGYLVTVSEPTRNLEQNSAQWPILQAFADQLLWPVNGVPSRLTAEEFKHILTAAYRQESVRLAAGLDGGFVMLGSKTSIMSKAVFSDWLDFLHATAALRGVKIYAE